MSKYLFLIILLSYAFSNFTFPQSGIGKFEMTSRWATGTPDPIQMVGDFNGDGLTDKVRVDGQSNFWVALSNAKSFDKELNWTLTQDTDATKYYTGDFNGDGLDDIISFRFQSGIWKVSLADQRLKDGHYYFKAPDTME